MPCTSGMFDVAFRLPQTSSKAVFWRSEASFAATALEAVLAAAQRPPSNEDSLIRAVGRRLRRSFVTYCHTLLNQILRSTGIVLLRMPSVPCSREQHRRTRALLQEIDDARQFSISDTSSQPRINRRAQHWAKALVLRGIRHAVERLDDHVAFGNLDREQFGRDTSDNAALVPDGTLARHRGGCAHALKSLRSEPFPDTSYEQRDVGALSSTVGVEFVEHEDSAQRSC